MGQTKIQYPQVAQNYGNEEKCPICSGTGWEIYWKPQEMYGGALTRFAKECTRCYGSNEYETGSPPQFRFADISKFLFDIYTVDMSRIRQVVYSLVNDFRKWSEKGKGLYLWSQTSGSGKTFLSCCVGNSIAIKYKVSFRFVTSVDFLSEVADSYKRERGEYDSSNKYRECKVLVLDDLGTQAGKDWQQQEIFRLINKRLEDGNITIYTSNMPPEQLNLNDRTIDRIVKSSVTIQMPEEGIRLQKAKEEQEHFLRDIVGI